MRVIAFFILFLSSISVFAQHLPDKYDGFDLQIRTKDYQTYNAQIIEIYDNAFRIRRDNGEEISILKDFIISIRYDISSAIDQSIMNDSLKFKITIAGQNYIGKFLSAGKEVSSFRTFDDTLRTRIEAISRIEYYGKGQLNKIEKEQNLSSLTNRKDEISFDDELFIPLYVGSYQHNAPDEYIASYTNRLVFLNSLDLNVNKHFGISLGTIPLPFGVLPIWVSPRISVPIKEELISVGLSSLLAIDLYSIGFVGGLEGISTFIPEATFGSHNNNLTVGAGYNFSEFNSTPVYKLSAMLRLTERFYLITDNVRFNEGFISVFAGKSALRYLNLTYGLIVAGEYDFIFPFPYVGASVPFKRK